MTTLMALTAGVLFACGTYLVLGRQLSRLIIGIGLLGHGANVIIVLAGGFGGEPAFVGGDVDDFADPLPQALVLTAIVITFGVIAFLLALAYRSWVLNDDDHVEDDVEDLRILDEALHRAAEEADRVAAEEAQR
jgi:multicomponent Na+:H+ antiporter subunit C